VPHGVHIAKSMFFSIMHGPARYVSWPSVYGVTHGYSQVRQVEYLHTTGHCLTNQRWECGMSTTQTRAQIAKYRSPRAEPMLHTVYWGIYVYTCKIAAACRKPEVICWPN